MMRTGRPLWILIAVAIPLSAHAWPEDDAWLAVDLGGGPGDDVAGDASSGLDLTGAPGLPALSWWADRQVVAVRLHLDAPPSVGPGWSADTWGVLWQLDGDAVPEAMLAVQGDGPVVSLYRPAMGATGLVDASPWTPVRADVAGLARVVDDGMGGAFVDLSADRAVLEDELGLDATRTFRWAAVTFAGQADAAPSDVWGCDGAGACDAFDALVSDALVLDADDDGLTLPVERRLGSDPEVPDTDGGGLLDGQEDVDGDGVIGRWETDPTNPDDDVDSDGDGIPDVLERDASGQPVDTDDDDLIDELDVDSDADGLPDRDEGFADPDGDGLPAFRDPDADGDGVPDGIDGLRDPDGDGLPAYLDRDADDDGIEDGVEGVADLDGDGTPNHLDLDADDDGLPDAEEGVADLDCDGRPDFLDDIPDDGFCDTDLPVGAVDDSPFGGLRPPGRPVGPEDFPAGCVVVPVGGSLSLLWMVGVLGLRRRR